MVETPLEWPADLGYATIVGRFGFMDADGPDEDREPDITPATSGTVLITPSVDTVKYDGELGPMLLIKRRVEGVIDADGYLCTKNADGTPGPRGIVVPATDADVQPTGFTYSVRISLASSGTVASYSIKAPTGAVVDLAKATPVASSGGTVTVVDYTSAERAETAATTAVEAKDKAVQARNDAVQASQTATTAAGIADTRATDASTSASTAADILAQTQALGITVDTTVGTRVFVGDTMIYGDTGWRDWTSLLHEYWESPRRFHVRRENSVITLAVFITRASTAEPVPWNANNISLLNTENSVIPEGFRPYEEYNYYAYAQSLSGYSIGLSAVSRMREMRLRSLSAPTTFYLNPGNTLTFTTYWTTNDPWPTSLPGSPA